MFKYKFNRKYQNNTQNNTLKNHAITFADLTPYQLGIFWSIGSYIKSDKRMVFRHNSKYHLEQLESLTNSTIYELQYTQHNKPRTQYVLKSSNFDIDTFIENNWNYRNAEQRDVPFLLYNQYTEFLRAYLEIHSSLDYRNDKTTKPPCQRLRLRVYGNQILLQSINTILYDIANVNLKTLQSTSNKTTKVLYYQSYQEIFNILDMVSGTPNDSVYWNDIDVKLSNPKILL